MASGATTAKATSKDIFLIPAEELVLDRDWNGRWTAINDEPVAGDDKGHEFDKSVQMSIRELANSIKEHGQLEDVLITKRPADPDGRIYHVVAGQSRTRAITLLGKDDPQGNHKVRCRLLPGEMSADEAFLLNEEENRKRNNLTMLDKAYCMSREKTMGSTDNDISIRWGCTVQAVGQALALIAAPPEVQQAVADKIVSGTDVITTMKPLTEEEQLEIVVTGRAAKAKNQKFGSAQVKEMARKYIGARKAATPTDNGATGQAEGETATNGAGAAGVTTDQATAPVKPPKKGPGRPASAPKVKRGLGDLLTVLEGREGPLSQVIKAFLNGDPNTDEDELKRMLDEYEYGATDGDVEMTPRTEGNPVDAEA